MTKESASLQDLNLSEEYRSDVDDLASDLFVPCLTAAVAYDRAVGYFTSYGLAAAARGLDAFIDSGGQMRLVASPMLDPVDVEAIERGIAARDDVILRALLRHLAAERSNVDASQQLLAWLIAENRLEIRLAIPTEHLSGIYHEKIGVFEDGVGDLVAITGSANETAGGLLSNFESVDVFTSWGPTRSRVLRKRENFERLWDDSTRGVRVAPFPEEALQTLVAKAPHHDRVSVALPSVSIELSPDPPKESVDAKSLPSLRPYQKDAVSAWEAAGRRGILAMATGTGKTLTAIHALRQLAASEPRTSIIVLAPYIHLVDQWLESLRAAGLRPLACYEASKSWEPAVREALDFHAAGVASALCLVATYATNSLPAFQKVLEDLDSDRLLLIADEVHHMGAQGNRSSAPWKSRFRLGLSATPDRGGDTTGSKWLEGFFGGVVYEFGISSAIEAGVLSPYEYQPSVVTLEADELEEYEAIMAHLESELSRGADAHDSVRVGKLLQDRARVLDNARGKLQQLRMHLTDFPQTHTLVYCAGRTQLAAVMDLLWSRGIAARQFTGEESRAERARVLAGFADGTIPALVAIRCLDEGVDIPAARTAYLLASSGDPREFIQRRGRLLRTSPGKRSALIADYVVIPRSSHPRSEEITRRELGRAKEFARDSKNASSALASLWDVLDYYGVLGEAGG